MSATLHAENLSVSYPGVPVLDGVDLTLEPGLPPLGLVGPSGVGKTTLIETLMGQIKPDAGTVTWDGRNVHRMSRRDKRRFNGAVRAVSQYSMTVTDPKITAGRVLKVALSDARKAGRTHATSVAELLGTVGLQDRFEQRSMISLSGGERQRVALARALATRPDILLLDEPLTAVDPRARIDMARHIGELAGTLRTSILLASHDLELVERMCPNVVVLAHGSFVAFGPLREVLATSEHPAVQDMAESIAVAHQPFRP
ncbi:MAG TPA: ABC transporter ATP-binding protein [Beutenbergiaceae bacterium]|nr:ABC transporter ATP-binding protein [Beutenbergiaceae bacterium]